MIPKRITAAALAAALPVIACGRDASTDTRDGFKQFARAMWEEAGAEYGVNLPSGGWNTFLRPAPVFSSGGQGFADGFAVARLLADKSGTSLIAGAALVVFKGAKNRDAAWKLIRRLSEPDIRV